jgi:hypothetical protein
MLFADPAYPDSIESVRGLSHAEPRGRWSDGPVVEIRFSKPLPDAFDLHLRIGRAFGTNKGAPVKVKAGSQEQTLVVDSEPFDATLRFRGVGDADAPCSGSRIRNRPPSAVKESTSANWA